MTIPLESIRKAITRVGGQAPTDTPEAVGGGCIHQAIVIGTYFVKLNRESFLGMFKAEAEALRALAATKTIRVPEPVTTGTDNTTAFLVMERLDLGGPRDESRLGEQLAALHRHTGPAHGWRHDNFIGSTPQPNPRTNNWPAFFRDHRIAHMLGLLAARGITFPNSRNLLERIPQLLAGVTCSPALLHGDLWGGNAGFLGDRTPVVFDPAAHHGHRETDLAMTTLFGGFSSRFYDAYESNFPSDPGHENRRELYNLYHILNHALLFGGSYISQATAMIRHLAG